MAWLKIDDGFARHPKIVKVSLSARWAHVTALCYCAEYGTSGTVPKNVAKTYAKPREIQELLDAKLWEQTGRTGDYVIHDFSRYNPTGDELESKRAMRHERAVKGAQARWAKHAKGNASGNASSMLDGCPVPVPQEHTSVEHLTSFGTQPSHAPRAAADDPDRWKLQDTEAFALTVLNIFNETFGTTWGPTDRALRPIVQALGAYPHTKDEAMQRRICEHVLGGEAWWEKDRPGTRPGTGVVYAGAQYERHLHDLGLATVEVDEGVTQPSLDALIAYRLGNGRSLEEVLHDLRDTRLAPGVVLPAANGGMLAAPIQPTEGSP